MSPIDSPTTRYVDTADKPHELNKHRVTSTFSPDVLTGWLFEMQFKWGDGDDCDVIRWTDGGPSPRETTITIRCGEGETRLISFGEKVNHDGSVDRCRYEAVISTPLACSLPFFDEPKGAIKNLICSQAYSGMTIAS